MEYLAFEELQTKTTFKTRKTVKQRNTVEDSRIQGHNLTHIESSAVEWLHLTLSVLHRVQRLKRDSVGRERVCMQQRENIHKVSSLVCTALFKKTKPDPSTKYKCIHAHLIYHLDLFK